MDSEKKILSAEPAALPQTLNVSIVIVAGVIHQEEGEGGSSIGGGGGRGGVWWLFCPSFMSASAFQTRLKLHLSVNSLVNSFRLLLLLLRGRRLMADAAFFFLPTFHLSCFCLFVFFVFYGQSKLKNDVNCQRFT